MFADTGPILLPVVLVEEMTIGKKRFLILINDNRKSRSMLITSFVTFIIILFHFHLPEETLEIL